MMRLPLLLLICVALPAMAADRAAVIKLLQGYEWHADKAALDKLGADTDQTLMDIASDSTATNIMRGRAMVALTLYPNDKVWKWFEDAVTGSRNLLLRRRAVDGMCKTFAGKRADAVVAVLTPLLVAQDAHLRVRVAQCLRKIGGNKAEAVLSAYRDRISAPWEARAAGFNGVKNR